MNEASLGLLVAAVLVGFAAAWLGFEVRRAWAPESVRGAGAPVSVPARADDLTLLMPALVDEVTKLRGEIAAVRAAELEVALRNRHRELLLTQAIRTSAAEKPPAVLADAEQAVPPIGEAPVEDELVDDPPVDDTPIEEVPVGEAPAEPELVDDTPDDDVIDDADDEIDSPPDLTPGDIAALSAVARG